MPADCDAPRTVLIAGGGIGGLATAIALARHGIVSQVLERRSDYREDGAGIQIGPSGTKILSRLGVAPLLQSRAVIPECVHVREAAGDGTLARLPLGTWIASRHGAPYWVAHRRDLHSALLTCVAAQPLITLSMGVDVTDVCDESRVTARAADGQSWTADALIVADGVWSKLRAQVFPHASLCFTGKVAARAVVPASSVAAEFTKLEVCLWLARGAHVVHYPVASGQDIALVAIFDGQQDAPGWSTARTPDWVRYRARSYSQSLQRLLAVPTTWRSWSLQALSRVTPFAHGRMALVGDAGHPVLPFLAQGGVLALEDAVVLAHCLAYGGGDVANRLAAYAGLRRGRASRVARASSRNGRIYHFGGPVGRARDLGLKLLAPERVMAGYDWLYGWDGPRETA